MARRVPRALVPLVVGLVATGLGLAAAMPSFADTTPPIPAPTQTPVGAPTPAAADTRGVPVPASGTSTPKPDGSPWNACPNCMVPPD
jgi:hypothetical protein